MATTEVAVSPQVTISSEQIQAARAGERIPDPCIVVIFGASGDLTKRKLLPALYHLEQAGLLPKKFAVVGVARRPLGDQFATEMREGILKGGGVEGSDPQLKDFLGRLDYHAMDFDDKDGYTSLKTKLDKIDKKYGIGGGRLFYLAVAPGYFAEIVDQLGAHGLTSQEHGAVRVIIEKPFGHDLDSARKLNDNVNKVLSEDQVFRIDHYLGKETVQNILVFRFANGIFEPVWNRNFIDHVQITAAESIGIEGRGAFYEKAGTLRDVVQNHVMELLAFVAMEPPVSFSAPPIRGEKIKVWKAIQPIRPEETVRGQYGPGTIDGQAVAGYRQEKNVDPGSHTETFAALKLEIESWRWAGVPFYLRAGKRLAKRSTEITIQFRQPPLRLFKESAEIARCGVQPNIISMRIQPNEGISLRFAAKLPGPAMQSCPVKMDFDYAKAFGPSSANGYERLLIDAMLGDSTLFLHRDGVEATWALMTPVLEAWNADPPKGFPNYSAGSWGPAAADELLARDGRRWRQHLPPASSNGQSKR